MKRTLRALSLSLILSSPLAVCLSVEAQPLNEPAPRSDLQHSDARLAQDERGDREWDAYANSGYSYWDARMLANFWNDEVSDAKATIGRKLMWGGINKIILEQNLMDARIKALAGAENLNYFFDAGYSYKDAKALAGFWGSSDIYENKVRIERNIIMGNQHLITEALRLAQDRG